MGLARKLNFAVAIKPLTLFRCISFNAAARMNDFENAIEVGLTTITAKAGQFTRSDYQFFLTTGSASSIEAAS